MRRDRQLLYSAGYASAMARAHADLHAQHTSHLRDYAELCRELEALKAEVAELRKTFLANSPDMPPLGQRLN